MAKIKVVHYINQFFAQIGGEEKADYPVELRVGEVVGPGMALTQNFKDEAEIIATIICGDSYFNENLEKAKAEILEMVKEQAPDVFIAGPAFNAGRDGKSQSLADSDPAADAVVTGGNANQVIILPKLDKVIGTLDYVTKIAGASEETLREDGSLEVELQVLTGATNETGFNRLSAR